MRNYCYNFPMDCCQIYRGVLFSLSLFEYKESLISPPPHLSTSLSHTHELPLVDLFPFTHSSPPPSLSLSFSLTLSPVFSSFSLIICLSNYFQSLSTLSIALSLSLSLSLLPLLNCLLIVAPQSFPIASSTLISLSSIFAFEFVFFGGGGYMNIQTNLLTLTIFK